MGFFVHDDAVVLRAKPRPARVAIAQPVTMMPREALGCDGCTLKATWTHILSPQMPISGAADADILLLGEAPGETEDQEGVAFVGPSGKLLRENIPGRMRDRCAFQNVVRCRPDQNRDPTPQEAFACSVHLHHDITALPLKVVVGIGATPLKRYLNSDNPPTITAVHGIRFPIDIAGKLLWYYPVIHPSFVLHYGGERGPVYPVFMADMKRLFAEVDHWPQPEIVTFNPARVIMAQSAAEVQAIIAQMDRPLAWDIETPALRPFRDPRILTSAFSDGKQTVAFSCEHPEAPNDWGLPLTKDIVTSTPVIMHNAAFELLWLCYRFGLEALPSEFHDTMALARIAQEREGLLSLSALSRIYLGTDVKQISQIDTRRMLDYPLSHILPYNGLDAEATALLYHKLCNADRWQVQKIINTIKSTMAMELRGLPIDLDASRKLHEEFDGKRKTAEVKARQLYEVRQFESAKGVKFNIGSPQQIATALVEYGKCELPKTSRNQRDSTADIEKLAAHNPLAACVIDYREANKLCSTYIDPILQGTEYTDGHIHPGYTTMHTATLRLSGTNMNIQNFPKRKHREIRQQIVAPKGHVLVSIDYGQLEARVMAMASLDRFLCEAIITGYDIHADWRDKLLQLYPPYMERLKAKSGETDERALMKAGRDNIKNDVVFALFFGSSARSCAENTSVPLMIMQRLVDQFWQTFSGVQNWIKRQRRHYQNTGTTVTLTNRVRRSVLYGNEPINNPIQGTAADIVIEAQNEVFELARRERDDYLLPRIQVHDDLTFILPDAIDVLQDYIDRITSILVKPRFDFVVVPLMVEVSVGDHWAGLETIAKITGRYHR